MRSVGVETGSEPSLVDCCQPCVGATLGGNNSVSSCDAEDPHHVGIELGTRTQVVLKPTSTTGSEQQMRELARLMEILRNGGLECELAEEITPMYPPPAR